MTKPKPPGTLRKKSQAFGASKDRATKVKSEHNERISLLSRLPIEVRRNIWRYVLGDTVLHVRKEFPHSNCGSPVNEPDDEDYIRPCNLIACSNDRTLRQLYEYSKTPNEGLAKPDKILEGWTQFPTDENLLWSRAGRSHELCHDECCKFVICEEDENRPYLSTLRRKPHWGSENINLLRTCRMVYHEASNVLWTTNTFSFRERECFSEFMRARTTTQARLLTKLHFNFYHWNSSTLSDWEKHLSLANIRKLTNLREVHIYFTETFLERYQHDREYIEPAKLNALAFLKNLRISPLREVTVIIDTDHFRETPVLSDSQRLEWAKEIRNELLDPDAKAKWEADRSAEIARQTESRALQKSIERARKKRLICSKSTTAEECARDNQETQNDKDARGGRKRRKPFVAKDCGCGHKVDMKRGIYATGL